MRAFIDKYRGSFGAESICKVIADRSVELLALRGAAVRSCTAQCQRGNCHDNAVAESFFSALKKATGQAAYLSRSGNGHHGTVRLHRNVL